jgi:anthranilate phosphoribosyltransferase
MRHVAPVRKLLGVRTIFNLLGPLANPAAAKRQVLGVFDAAWVEPYARSLMDLGCERAFIVHGSDGMDELTTTGPSQVAEIRDGAIRFYQADPDELGLARVSPEALRGRDATYNADAIIRVLEGEPGPFADLAQLNAAAALIAADRAADLRDGLSQARAAIAAGSAREALERLRSASNG